MQDLYQALRDSKIQGLSQTRSAVPGTYFELKARRERGAGEAAGDVLSVKNIPFIGTGASVIELRRMNKIAHRMQAGLASEDEQAQLLSWVAEQRRPSSFLAGAIDVAAQSLAFGGEFLATEGGATLVRGLLQAGGKRLVGKVLSEATMKALKEGAEKGIGRIVARSAAKGVEIAAQGALMEAGSAVFGGGMVEADAYRRAMPQIGLSQSESGQWLTTMYGTSEDFTDNLDKALTSYGIELFSEHSGDFLQRLPLLNRITLMQGTVAAAWMKRHNAWIDDLSKEIAKRAGWHGPIFEYLEEIVGGGMRAAAPNLEDSWEDVFPGIEGSAQMLLGFMLPGAVAKGASAAIPGKKAAPAGDGSTGAGAQPSQPSRAGQGPVYRRPVAPESLPFHVREPLAALGQGLEVVQPANEKEQELVDVAAGFGQDVVLVRRAAGGEGATGGVVPGHEGVLFLDVTDQFVQPEALRMVWVHEALHDLEAKDSKAWKGLMAAVRRTNPKMLEMAVAAYRQDYEALRASGVKLPELAKEDAQREGLSYLGEQLGALVWMARTNEGRAAIRKIAQEKPGAVKAALHSLRRWVGDLLRRLTGRPVPRERLETLRDLEKRIGEALTGDRLEMALVLSEGLETIQGRIPPSRRLWGPEEGPPAPAKPEPEKPARRMGQPNTAQTPDVIPMPQGPFPAPEPELTAEQPQEGVERPERIRDAMVEGLLAGFSWKTGASLEAWLKDNGYEVPSRKEAEELMEQAVVIVARHIVVRLGDHFAQLVELYERQPKLLTRDSSSQRRQAFSTPAPLAYVASRLADVRNAERVLEPTAGHGILLMEASSAQVEANEIDPGRATFLREYGFQVSQKDAVGLYSEAGEPVQAIVANPPFGKIVERGKGRQLQLPSGKKTKAQDHVIALEALQRLTPRGKAVLILGSHQGDGAKRTNGYRGVAASGFWKDLYDGFNVVDHFTVDGKLYERQGSAWPVDVVVIDGQGKSALGYPYAKAPRVLGSWDEVREVLDGRTQGVEPVGGQRVPGGTGAEGAGGDSEPGGVQAPADREAGGAGGEGEPGGAGGSSEGARPPRARKRRPVDRGEGTGPGGRDGGVAEPAPRGGGVAGEGQPERAGGEAQPSGGEPNGLGREGGADELGDLFDDVLGEAFPEPKAAEPAEQVLPDPTPDDPYGDLRALYAVPRADWLAAPAWSERGDTRRVFVSDLWEQAGKPGTLEDFKADLWRRHVAGEIEMARADLVEAMPPEKVKASEYMAPNGARVHFVKRWDESARLAVPSRYDKAKPGFIRAAKEAGVDGSDPRTLIQAIVQLLRDTYQFTKEQIAALKDDVVRFAREVKAGIVKLTEDSTQEQGDEFQVPYTPSSRGKPMQTLMPKNHHAPFRRAMAALEERVGNIDEYVRDRLGWELDELHGRLGAEQIDAVALAVENIERGKGFILADQTGVGKGRVVASVLRYARLQGKVPVFVTVDAGLYGDMIRDLRDIGEVSSPFITNANEVVPVGDGETLKSHPKKVRDAGFQSMLDGKIPEGFSQVFTTYYQMQSSDGKRSERHAAIAALMPNAFLVLDESHKAGGPANEPTRTVKRSTASLADWMRDRVADAAGVLYSSATYAKNPNVMKLYLRTDLGDVPGMEEALQHGGVPIQQIISEMLVEAGQLVRRERSYDGIPIKFESRGVDRGVANMLATSMNEVFAFDTWLDGPRDRMKDYLAQKYGIAMSDSATGSIGAESSTFASLMHNIAKQGLLALKARAAADLAIELWKKGEKPLIGLENTMGEALSEAVLDNQAALGDEVDVGLQRTFHKYLNRMLRFTIRQPGEDRASGYITADPDLWREAGMDWVADEIERIRQFIDDIDDSQLPGSPIDAMRDRMTSAGMKVDELTGRDLRLDYGVLTRRVPSTKAKKDAMAAFNTGQLDALILNAGGSTGFSLHASSRPEVTDKRKRHMIVVQPHPDINVFMQMLGRINRTGQVVLPEYTILQADIPAEIRPGALLRKKLQSLNANATAAAEGSVDVEAVDFINPIGDSAVYELFEERPWWAAALDLAGVKRDLARRASGRVAVFPVDAQEEFFTAVAERYQEKIDALEAIGENPLRASDLDLDARIEKAVGITPVGEGDSPFQEAAVLEVSDVKRVVKPLPYDDVMKKGEPWGPEMDTDAERAFDSWKRDKYGPAWREIDEEIAAETDAKKVAKLQLKRERLDKELASKREVLTLLTYWTVSPPGQAYLMVEHQDGGGSREFVAVKVSVTRRPAADLLLLSSYQVGFYTDYSPRVRKVSLAAFRRGSIASRGKASEAMARDAFDGGANEQRELRQLVTGNLVAGMAKLSRGQVVYFTSEGGERRRGILLPAKFDAISHLEDQPVPLTSEQAREFMLSGRTPVMTPDRKGSIDPPRGSGTFRVNIRGKWTRAAVVDDDLLELTSDQSGFSRSGQATWKALVHESKLVAFLEILRSRYSVTWSAHDNKELARAISNAPKASFAVPRRKRLFADFTLDAESKFDLFRRFVQDEALRIRRAVEKVREMGGVVTDSSDPYGAIERMPGKVRAIKRHVEREYRRPLAQAVAALAEKHGVDQEKVWADLDLYLIVRHAGERNVWIATKTEGATTDGAGISTEDAEAELERLEGIYGSDLEAPAATIWRLNDYTKRILLDFGLISQATFDRWTELFEHYVPLRTHEEETMTFRGGRGHDVRGVESYAAWGRGNLADSPVTWSFEQAERAANRGPEAEVGQALVQLILDNPEKTLWSAHVDEDGELVMNPAGWPEWVRRRTLADNEFSTKIKGKEWRIVLNDPLMARALKRLGSTQSGPLIRTLGRVNRWLSMVNTSYDLGFMVSNFLRDLQTAGINIAAQDVPGLQKEMLLNALTGKPGRAVWRVLRDPNAKGEWEDWFREFEAAGGRTGWNFYEDWERQAKALRKLARMYGDNPAAQARRVLEGFFELVSDANDAVEQNVRLAAYVAARKRGASKAKAASLAKNLTVNFNRKGELGTSLNSLYLFYNAGVQGTTLMLKAMRHPKVRRLVGGVFALGIGMELLNRALAGPDDDDVNLYDRIPDWVKDKNLILMLPGGSYLKVPLPYGFNFFFVAGRNVAAMMPRSLGGEGRSVAQATGSLGSTAWTAFSPFGGEFGGEGGGGGPTPSAWQLAQIVSPTLTDPLVELATNKTFYGGPIHPDQPRYGVQVPNHTLFWGSVSAPTREAARWLSNLTGGDEVRGGWVDVSPESIEHVIGFAVGAPGRFAGRLWSIGEAFSKGEAPRAEKVPVLRRLYGSNPPWALTRHFYQAIDELELVQEHIDLLRDRGDRERAAEIERGAGRALRLLPEGRKVRRKASLMRRNGASDEEVRNLLAGWNRRLQAVGGIP